ncbi:S8 family serine peptidase [Rathayibacter soli]|uniref:S8 family serine peptidase n=1 Tax=Rathayibacter soli TaxID=3144168 RepID=UPI0027E3F647|nr:S8 family serine peptidase [Glaciibacter superstes]
MSDRAAGHKFKPPVSTRLFRALTVTAVAALVGSGLALAGGRAASAAPAPAPAQAPGTGSGLNLPQPVTHFKPGKYIVTLAQDAAATYTGDVSGYAATKPQPGHKLAPQSAKVKAYSGYLKGQQKKVADAAGVSLGYTYTVALNGFSAQLSAKQAAQLVATKGVVAVTPDAIQHVQAESDYSFLGLDGSSGVWAGVGGTDKAGAGIVVGDIDTGIAPENPSFAGAPLGTTPGAAPYLDGSTITFAKADGNTFHGVCQTGEQFTASDCSTKLIGARYYLDGFGAGNIGNASTGEYVSPRDGDGHGSHTASTAAGNNGVPASIAGTSYGVISGMAPAAKIAAYKACWEGPDPTVTTDDGCATSDLLAAINQAVADGVDVINFSIGGGAATTTVSLTDQAFLGAASAGIFVAAAGGNAGPGASTLDNAAPWETTVAASSIPSYEATATLGNRQAYAGASITVDTTPGATPLTGDLVRADLVANAGVSDAILCGPNSLDPTKVTGKIVFCQRGTYDRVAKSAEVKRAGGIGMLLVNKTPGSTDLDEHSVPTIHLDAQFYDPLSTYAATPGATVTFTPGNTTGVTPPTPQVAGFSSRGPVEADGSDILKPDIAAPGVAIIADGANAQGATPTFQFESGTSMATPHIAGLAALYLGVHPNATPSEIKSAMMTTAYNTVDASGAPVTDPFTQGAGHVDPTKYFNPGLLYLSGTADWYAYIQGIGYDVGVAPIDPSNLNLASISVGAMTAPKTVTRTVTSTQAGTFTAKPISIPGIDAVVSPSTLTFGAAGESQSYSVTFTRTDAPLDSFATGSLDWVSGSTIVHSPIAVRPVTIVAPAAASGTGRDGSVGITVTPGGNGPIALKTSGLATGVTLPDAADKHSPHSGSGTPGAEFSYEVQVPTGVQLQRFDLVAVNKTADLDLTVYLLDGPNGNPVAGWQSATSSSDERVDLPNADAGYYLIYVDDFSGSTAFDMTTYSVLPGAGVGSFAVTPSTLAGVQGMPVTYQASWTKLKKDARYLGLVEYGDTGRTTVVAVSTVEAQPSAPVNTAAPAIKGMAVVGQTLTASPGSWTPNGLKFSYQWQANGKNIAKATSSRYKVTSADQGASITVLVTASKKGLPSASAVSPAVVVKYESTATLSLSKSTVSSGQSVTATVTVTSKAATPPSGAVTLTVDRTTIRTTLDATGTAKVAVPKLSRGNHTLRATYAGNDTIAGSTSNSERLQIKG